MECVAFNGPAGNGVYAVARCCVIAGLQCQAHASAEPGQDAHCVGPQHHLTGKLHVYPVVLLIRVTMTSLSDIIGDTAFVFVWL